MKDLLVWELAQQQVHGEESIDVNGISGDSYTDSEHILGVTNENYRKMCCEVPYLPTHGIRLESEHN